MKHSATLLLLALLLCVGCQHAGGQKGVSSMEFLAPHTASAAKAKIGETGEEMTSWVNHIDAHPRSQLAKPAYPLEVLERGGEACIVYATVSIDEFGRVIDVSPSWDHVGTPSKNSDKFFAAVKQAVEDWSIEPAVDVYWERRAGHDEYVRTERRAAQFQVKFTFDVSGNVR